MKLSILGTIFAACLATVASAQSYEFVHGTGADMQFDVAADPALSPETGLTVEAWVQYDETAVTPGLFRWPTVCRMNPTPNSETYMIRVDAANNGTRNLKWLVRTNTGATSVIWNFNAGQLSTWTHLAGTYDGSDMRLFVNGVEVASQPKTGTLTFSNDVLRIGNGDVTAPGQEVWSGKIDEVRIWPFARTAEEITQTMPMELAAVPGGVITFNLTPGSIDSSLGLSGALTGGATIDSMDTPLLTQTFSSSSAYGNSTSSCGAVNVSVGSPPAVNNLAFSPRVMGLTPGSTGLFFASRALQTPAIIVAGLEILIDPTLIRVTIPTTPANSLGVAEVVASVPNEVTLAGRPYASQFLFIDSNCGSPFVTSEGLAITILP